MQNETDHIVLNAVDLTIDTANVLLNDDPQPVEASDISFCCEQETVTIRFAKVLPTGSDGVLNVTFKGNLNDKMKGFYRSKYYTPSGDERYGGVTQL